MDSLGTTSCYRWEIADTLDHLVGPVKKYLQELYFWCDFTPCGSLDEISKCHCSGSSSGREERESFLKKRTERTFIVKNGILINELKILSKGIDSYITGSVLKLNTKKPQTDLKISLNKSRMESLIPLLPGEESLVPDVNLYKLKKYPYYGDILGNLEVKGNTNKIANYQ